MGSGSSRMYSFSSDATVWTSVVLWETGKHTALACTDYSLA